jgi:hypothetical protein
MRRRSRALGISTLGISTTPLPVLPETPLNTFSHYARLSGMAPAPLALARRVVQACGARLREPLGCCCYASEPKLAADALAADALALFNALALLLEDAADAPWPAVELELTRCADCSLVLVSTCRAHTLEFLAFDDMDSVCIGVVYRGPASFSFTYQ